MKVHYEANYWDDLFSWKDLERLINIRPLMTTDRVNILGDEGGLKWSNTGWTKDPNCFPPSLIKDALDKNIIFFSDMTKCTKKVNDFSKMLEKEYRLQTDAHIYVCRNTNIEHYFGAHFDWSDNVIVQCEGETNFKVWDKVKDREQQPYKMNITEDPILDVVMKPGDAIWIPRYHPHEAISRSIRLSVSFPMYNFGHFFEERKWISLTD
tara:strand:+ start:572 stop:1198 length:627 start_codon:yes stop_codon:yes gene_type:complete